MDLTDLDAAAADLPPAPWVWRQVTPASSRHDPDPQPSGFALVAADGAWVVWAESGYGSPDVLPGVGPVLAVRNRERKQARRERVRAAVEATRG